MSQSSKAKAIRAAVRRHEDSIRDKMVADMLTTLYLSPLRVRAKWALRILRGYRTESTWALRAVWTADWLLERFTRWAGDLMWPAKIDAGKIKAECAAASRDIFNEEIR